MAAALIVPEIASHMNIHEPVHPAAQIPIREGPNHEMKMIWHQAVGDHSHRYANPRFGHRVKKGEIIAVLMEDLGASVSTVQYMVTEPSRRSTRRSRQRLFPKVSRVRNA